MTPIRPFVGALCLVIVLATWGCGQSVDQRLLGIAQSLDSFDADKASFEAKAILQTDPENGRARLLLAQALLQLGDVAGAEVELQRAKVAEGDADTLLGLQADVWMLQGQPNQVMGRYDSMTAEGRKPGPAFMARLVQSYLALGQIDQAKDGLAEALKTSPTDLALRILAIRVQAAEGRVADALKQSQGLVAAEPKSAQAWLLLGDVQQLSRAKEEDIQTSYRKALETQPTLIAAHSALVVRQLLAPDIPAARKQVQALLNLRPNNAQARYLEAVVAAASGQLVQARELTQQLVRTAPKNPRVLLLAGQVEARLGSFELANTYLTQSVSLDATSSTPRRALAEFLLNRGQPARALDTLAPLTGRGSTDGHALVLQAQAHLQRGDAKAADAAFAAASKLIPSDPTLRTVRAQVQVERSPTAEALADLSRVARLDSSPRGEMALISAYMRKGDLRQTRDAVAALATKMPASPLPELLLGRISAKEGDRVRAEQHFNAALGKDPGFTEALSALVEMDGLEGNHSKAVSRIRTHIEKHPGQPASYLLLADLLQRQGQSAEASEQLALAIKADPSNPATHSAIIRRMARSGDSRGALEAAKAAVAALPDNLDLIEQLGSAQLQSGESNQAVTTLTRLVGKRDTSQSWLLLAQAHDAGGNLNKAEEAVRRAIALSPTSPVVLQAAVLVAVKQRKHDQALTLSRQIQQLNPSKAFGYQLEGDVLSSQQRWEQAVAAYRTALTKQETGSAPVGLHNALTLAGRQKDAAAFEATWLRQHPDDAGFKLWLANLAMQRNDLDVAVAGFRQVIGLKPGSVEAKNNLAQVLVLQNKKEAVKIAQEAFNLAPFRADVVDTLAQAQAADGRLDDAIETQLLAKKLAPKSPLIQLNLVRLYIKARQTDKAREALDAAAAEPWAPQRKQDIEALRMRLNA